MKKQELLRALKNQGFSDKILDTFQKIKREDFIPKEYISEAYENIPLEIGYSQTISQPYTIAFMLTLLDIKDKQNILEIGSGSGYALALMSKISKNSKIYGVERIKQLAERSKEQLKNNSNIKIINKDGSSGLADYAPYDRILVSAALEEMPNNLVKQLKFKGILVAPLRNSIVFIKKESGQNKVMEFPGFVFVPLIKEIGQ